MTNIDVDMKMRETWDFCLEVYGPRCVALCHHGSFNYLCNTPESDVDAKLIVVPTWNDIVNCAKPLSETIKGPYGDINVTDVRLFIGNNLRKQNFNFIECLFTPYKRVNTEYWDLWQLLIEHREDIAHYNPVEAVRTMMGQMENQRKRWGKFDDKKTLYHMLRIKHAIVAYVAGKDFERTLIPSRRDRDLIQEVRSGKVAQSDMEYFAQTAYEIVTNVAKCADQIPSSEQAADTIMEYVQERIMARAMEDALK